MSGLTCPTSSGAKSQRVALVSFLHKDGRSPEALWLELFLTSALGHDGRSPLDDWAEMLLTARDDSSKEAVLRLSLGNITPEKIACFKSQKKLVTTDITLEVRPRKSSTVARCLMACSGEAI